MEIQDFDLTIAKVKRRFKENANLQMVSLFRELRAEVRTDFFGDFAIMCEVVREADKYGKLTWKKMNTMLKAGEEYMSLPKGEKNLYYTSLLHTATDKLTLSGGRKGTQIRHTERGKTS